MRIIFRPESDADVSVRISAQKDSYVERDASGRRILVIGAGERRRITRRNFILLARQVLSFARQNKSGRLAIRFADFVFPSLRTTREDIARLLAQNFVMANFEFLKYKTEPVVSQIEEIAVTDEVPQSVRRSLEEGVIIGEETNRARILANTPGGEMTPALLAQAAEAAVQGLSVRVQTLGRFEMKEIGMGGILGVAQGSAEEPKFIILEYKKGGFEKPVVLVGKGVTFDSGGLNLKPSNSIYEMHMDMSGGAAVIHAIAAAARLKLKKNVIGIIPAVENMTSGSSYRPGDILKSLSGKTIEVLNTDAEGRVILADALTYAERYKPKLVVDVATLTGASMVALGSKASALFTKSEKLERRFRDLGEKSGDYLWPLPLWDEYEDDVRGTFGDWANVGKKPREGDAIAGAMFLYQFARNYPWVHLDIAPRMTASEGEHLAKGASGTPVRLLVEVIADRW